MVPNNVRLPLTRVDEHFYGSTAGSTNQNAELGHVTRTLCSHWSVLIILQGRRTSISLIYFSSSFSGGLFFVFCLCQFLDSEKKVWFGRKKGNMAIVAKCLQIAVNVY